MFVESGSIGMDMGGNGEPDVSDTTPAIDFEVAETDQSTIDEDVNCPAGKKTDKRVKRSRKSKEDSTREWNVDDETLRRVAKPSEATMNKVRDRVARLHYIYWDNPNPGPDTLEYIAPVWSKWLPPLSNTAPYKSQTKNDSKSGEDALERLRKAEESKEELETGLDTKSEVDIESAEMNSQTEADTGFEEKARLDLPDPETVETLD